MPINYKLYPPDWKTRIVPLVTLRSQNECEQCHLPNNNFVKSIEVKFRRGKKLIYRRDWIPAYVYAEKFKPVKVILTVAHIDNDSHNFLVKIDRLIHLCQLCHLRRDSLFKSQNRSNRPKTLRV